MKDIFTDIAVERAKIISSPIPAGVIDFGLNAAKAVKDRGAEVHKLIEPILNPKGEASYEELKKKQDDLKHQISQVYVPAPAYSTLATVLGKQSVATPTNQSDIDAAKQQIGELEKQRRAVDFELKGREPGRRTGH